MTKLRDHPVYHRYIAEQRRKDEELFRKAEKETGIGLLVLLVVNALFWYFI